MSCAFQRAPSGGAAFAFPAAISYPALSVIFCFLLMAGLPIITWLRFIVWLAIGLVIYILYSRKRSEFVQRIDPVFRKI